MSHQVPSQVADSAQLHGATIASYAASAVNVWFGLTINEWCMLVGAICALGTFAINWWYRHKDYTRAERIARNAERHNAKRRTEAL